LMKREKTSYKELKLERKTKTKTNKGNSTQSTSQGGSKKLAIGARPASSNVLACPLHLHGVGTVRAAAAAQRDADGGDAFCS
jgi:hypothetical protein